ncbi:MAG: hypothetical protein HYY25_06910 [Candidatus Wallbacteria bacterium]|nr:hypothetical protein [Candidatus Wallbacteria bacterium]
MAIAIGALAFFAAWLHPYAVGRLLEELGRPGQALGWLRQAPQWLLEDGELRELSRDAADAALELSLEVDGASVRYDPRLHDEAQAVRVAGHAARAARWGGRRLGNAPEAVPLRLPMWRNGALLGAYDHAAVNLSPRGAVDPRVIAHEVTHFSWYRALLAFPAFPGTSPLWLEEGMAELAAACAGAAPGADPLAGLSVDRSRWADLDGLDRQVRREHDYLQAACLVEYLVRTHGWARVRGFLAASRHGATIWTALGRGFGCWPDDLVEAWRRDFLARRTGSRGEPAARAALVSARLAKPAPVRPASSSVPEEQPAAVDVTRRTPPLGGCVLAAVLAAWATWRAPYGAMARLVACRRALLTGLALLAGLAGGRLFFGIGLDMAAPGGDFAGLHFSIHWRHRLLWVLDTALLALAAAALRAPSGLAVASGAGRWSGWGAGVAVAALAGLGALACGAAKGCSWRPLELWTVAAVLLVFPRAWAELTLFGELADKGSRRFRWVVWIPMAVLYGMWTHGPDAPLLALAFRAVLLGLAAGARSGAGLLWGWDVTSAIVLCREAMAPAKLGLLQWAGSADSGWGACGLDSWPPVMALALAALAYRALRVRQESVVRRNSGHGKKMSCHFAQSV